MKLSERIRNTKGLPWQRKLTDEIADEVKYIEDALFLEESVRNEVMRIAKTYKNTYERLQNLEAEMEELKSNFAELSLGCYAASHDTQGA